jgi:hypothetical protein
MSDPLAKLRESFKSGSYVPPKGTAKPIGPAKGDPLHALRSQIKAGEKVTAAPTGPKLTDALKSLEGRLLTAIATVNGHGYPLQYASDVLAMLKKITPA